jgi:CubicO group peptidase (beta-lactamase class C family)
MAVCVAGFSPERLARIEKLMKARYVDAGLLPGFQILAHRRGQEVFQSVSGLMDMARGTPVRDDTIFRIYSMTKPITAAAIMILAEEGAVRLDDDVHAYLPEFKRQGVYASGVATLLRDAPQQFVTTPVRRRMKVIDLLTHTAGLTYGFMMRTGVDAAYRRAKIGEFDTEGGMDKFIADAAAMPLEFCPGDAWNYSISLDVAAAIVERASGQTFADFLRTRLFEPLGMHDTAFFCPEDKLSRFASCYQPGKDGGLKLQDDAREGVFTAPPKLESGGGGLVSTAHDYMRFCEMFLGGGTLDGVQIFSPKTVALFSLNHLPNGQDMVQFAVPGTQFSETAYDGIGFSLGCGVTIDVAKTRLPGTVGEFFWGGAASTAFWIDPRENLAVVFMTQVIGTEARLTLRRDLRTLVYAAMTQSDAA